MFEQGFIEVDYEPEDEDDEEVVAGVKMPTGQSPPDDFITEAEDYEENDPFQKFVLRLERAPEQLCRYGGKPVWPTNERPAAVPVCEACGAARVFELQLLPTLISFLAPAARRMPDFGSVFVYSCAAQCRGRPCTDEFAFVASGQ